MLSPSDRRNGITYTHNSYLCLKHSQVHEQAQPAAMKRDEKHVDDIINHINNNMTNPF